MSSPGEEIRGSDPCARAVAVDYCSDEGSQRWAVGFIVPGDPLLHESTRLVTATIVTGPLTRPIELGVDVHGMLEEFVNKRRPYAKTIKWSARSAMQPGTVAELVSEVIIAIMNENRALTPPLFSRVTEPFRIELSEGLTNPVHKTSQPTGVTGDWRNSLSLDD